MFEQGVRLDFRNILWTRIIIRFIPRDISAVTRLRVLGLYRDHHDPVLHHPYDRCDHARPGSLKCDHGEFLTHVLQRIAYRPSLLPSDRHVLL